MHTFELIQGLVQVRSLVVSSICVVVKGTDGILVHLGQVRVGLDKLSLHLQTFVNEFGNA